MNICAKFQVSSWSRSCLKVWGGDDWLVGSKWLLCLTSIQVDFSQNYNKAVWFLPIFLILDGIRYCRKFLPPEWCSFLRKRFFVRDLVPLEEMKKFPDTRRILLSQEEICYHIKNKFPVTGKHFCHKKQFPVTLTNILSQEKFSCHGKKFFTKNIFPLRQS